MKKSKLLLVSGLLGTMYLLYLVSYFTGLTNSSNVFVSIGGHFATALVMPHMLCVGLSVIFTWVGWAQNARWGALVAGIMYSVSILLMFKYAAYVILQLILSFVAFAEMKKTTTVK